MKNTLLQAKNISVSYNKKKILDNVSLDIKEQDFTTIVGPNGAGKTSLLKILLNIKKADHGIITGKKGLKIGYLPQKLYLDGSMPLSALDFLKLNKNFNQADLEDIARQTKIENILGKQLSQLSGGEMQKILLSNSLMGNPELLILDEPDQNLDISGQLAFYEMLNKIYNSKKLSILMVSHDLHLVMSSTKKVICLFHHICCSGTPDMVSKNPEFASIFGKDMSKLVSVYNHYHSHSHG